MTGDRCAQGDNNSWGDETQPDPQPDNEHKQLSYIYDRQLFYMFYYRCWNRGCGIPKDGFMTGTSLIFVYCLKKISKPIIMQPFKDGDFRNFLAITPVCDMIRDLGIFKGMTLVTSVIFLYHLTKNLPNQISHTNYLKWPQIKFSNLFWGWFREEWLEVGSKNISRTGRGLWTIHSCSL